MQQLSALELGFVEFGRKRGGVLIGLQCIFAIFLVDLGESSVVRGDLNCIFGEFPKRVCLVGKFVPPLLGQFIVGIHLDGLPVVLHLTI